MTVVLQVALSFVDGFGCEVNGSRDVVGQYITMHARSLFPKFFAFSCNMHLALPIHVHVFLHLL